MSTDGGRTHASGTAAIGTARRLAGRRILYVTHRMPYPPHGGARVRAYQCIRHLAVHNSVTVAAPVRSRDEAAAARALAEAHGVTVLTRPIGRARALSQAAWGAATWRPASMGYFDAPGLGAAIRRAHEDEPFDLAIVHSSAVAPYVAALDGVAKVLDFVDMDSCKWRDYARHTRFPTNLVHRREAVTLARAEGRFARRFDLCLTATAHEAASLRDIAGDVPNAVVRNGVDLAYYGPGDEAYDPDTLCFVGRMDYFPNEQAVVAFCRDVLPRIRGVRPAARLRIVGADPTPTVRALADRPGVTVTGGVPDVRPYVRGAAATVVPLKVARGTQNKILESMAMGVPVIASTVAARGVAATPGEHLLTASTPSATAAHALRLMDGSAERDRLARAGRRAAVDHFAWAATLEALDRNLLWLVAGREHSGPSARAGNGMPTAEHVARSMPNAARATVADAPR